MAETPGVDPADQRFLRVQGQIDAARETARLTTEIQRLEAAVEAAETRRERANNTRFFVMCAAVLLGLASLVYLQVDSRGSGQLRAALVKQCTERNEGLAAFRISLEQQAQVAEETGNAEYAQLQRQFAQTLQPYDCAELR